VSLARRQAKILQVSNEQFGVAKNLLKANSVNIQDSQSGKYGIEPPFFVESE
jgi:hypothetical protein